MPFFNRFKSDKAPRQNTPGSFHSFNKLFCLAFRHQTDMVQMKKVKEGNELVGYKTTVLTRMPPFGQPIVILSSCINSSQEAFKYIQLKAYHVQERQSLMVL